MPDPTQVEQTVPAGNEGSGDPAFDAALVEASGTTPAPETTEPTTEPVVVEPPPVAEPDPDFTFSTLENGQREMRLATGQVYRGKDDAELYGQLAKAQVAASKRITELSRTPEPIAPVAPPQQAPDAIDPTALAIADLMAPAFGAKNGQELVAAFAEQNRIANAQQEFMAAQQANFEAANFFRAVPEFSKSQGDADRIDGFLQENGLPFNAKTAEMAYYTLKAKGEMNAAPVTTRPTAPKNQMPPPPTGNAPANTGKGAPSASDFSNMTTEDLGEWLAANSIQ
jgi:hypothetical protein